MVGLKHLGMAGLVVVAGILTVGTANADVDTGQFTSDHCSGGCFNAANPNAGTLTVATLANGDLRYTVNLAPGFSIVNTGFDASFAFGLDVGQIDITNLTAGFSIVNGPNPVSSGAIQVDGFGNFDYGVLFNTQGGGHGFTGTLQFDVANANGSPLALSDITSSKIPPGSQSTLFALDVLSPTGATGPVDDSTLSITTLSSVPEPASLAILATALAGLTVLGRRRRKDV